MKTLRMLPSTESKLSECVLPDNLPKATGTSG